MSADRLAIVIVCALAAGAGFGAYLVGAGSVPQEDDLLVARAEASSASFADAVPAGVAAGRAQGRKAAAVTGEAAATVSGGVAGARDGAAAVKRERQRRLIAGQAASATTRSEAEAQAPAELAGSGGVLVVGDSLEVGTSPYLGQYLSSTHLTVSAEVGLSSPEIFGLFGKSYDPSQSVIVFDAGTNDDPATPQILEGNLNAVAGAVGNRCLVVPTVHIGDADTTAMNRMIRSFAASHPGTQVPDWAGFAVAHPELMQDDGVHPTSAGYEQRAQLIAEGILGCQG